MAHVEPYFAPAPRYIGNSPSTILFLPPFGPWLLTLGWTYSGSPGGAGFATICTAPRPGMMTVLSFRFCRGKEKDGTVRCGFC